MEKRFSINCDWKFRPGFSNNYWKTDDTEKANFDVPENPQKHIISIHKNFRLVGTTVVHKINQMSSTFVNRFDVIVLKDQMESKILF